MQSFIDVAASTTLKNSRSQLTDNDKTIMSCSSGTAFPTTNLQIGMLCFRTDQNRLYQLKSTGPDTWILLADLTKDFWRANAVSTTGTNTYTATLDPAPTALVVDQLYLVKFGTANTSAVVTLNFNAIGAVPVKRSGGAALKVGDINANMLALMHYDGTNLNLLNHKDDDLLVGVATGGTDAYTATFDPVPTAYTTRKLYLVNFVNANTIAGVTIDVNGLGPRNVKRPGGTPLKVGDISANMLGLLYYDGTNMILLNPAADEILAVAASGTDTYTATLDPVPSAYKTGKIYPVQFPNANTIPNPTINFNSLGAKTIKKGASRALALGDIDAGMVGWLYFNGTDMLLLNPAKGVLRGKQTVYMPARAMQPNFTNGATPQTIELATNLVMLAGLDFDPNTNQYAQFMVSMPKGWDEGAVTAKFIWTASGGTIAQGCVWGIQAQAFSDADPLDAAWGGAVEVTDALLATTRVTHQSPDTGSMTVGASPVDRDLIGFRVYRNAAAVGDTLTVAATLIGVELTFNLNAADES